jgi:hypothetical protein
MIAAFSLFETHDCCCGSKLANGDLGGVFLACLLRACKHVDLCRVGMSPRRELELREIVDVSLMHREARLGVCGKMDGKAQVRQS